MISVKECKVCYNKWYIIQDILNNQEVHMEERMDFRILNNGSFIPSIGFGTYKAGTDAETEHVVVNALQSGYRLLDTARM